MDFDGLMIQHDSQQEKPPKKPGYDRKSQAKWDAKHMRTVSSKLTRDKYERLIDACIRRGTTPYRIIRKLLELWENYPKLF